MIDKLLTIFFHFSIIKHINVRLNSDKNKYLKGIKEQIFKNII